MTKSFSAIFENGVFRPVEPVDFPERCQVRVEVRSVEPPNDDASRDEGHAILPVGQRVRLVGRLAELHADTHTFGLALDDGHQITGALPAGDALGIAALVNQRVLVLGTAIYGPSGNLLRIDADDVSPSPDDSPFFSAIPRPLAERFDLDELLREQGDKRGVSAIFGQWPGDESDEQIATALKELS